MTDTFAGLQEVKVYRSDDTKIDGESEELKKYRFTSSQKEMVQKENYNPTIESSDLPDGDYYIIVEATDKSGNTATKSVHVMKDRIAPTGTITLDGENPWKTFVNGITFGIFRNTDQTFTITTKDETLNSDRQNEMTSKVSSTEYIKTNKVYESADELSKAKDWKKFDNATKDSLKVSPDEDVIIYLKITDQAGNVTYISSNGVVLDKTAADITLTYAKDNVWTNEELTIGVDVTDTFAGLQQVKIYRSNDDKIGDGDTELNSYASTAFSKVMTPNEKYTNTVKASDLPDGNYYIIVEARDKSGNITTKSVNVKKDRIAPVGIIRLGDDNAWDSFITNITFGIFKNNTQRFSITARDNVLNTSRQEDTTSGIKETDYILTNKIYENVSQLPENGWYRLNKATDDFIDVSPNEDVIIYLRITDNAGNVSYISSNGVVVDDTRPSGDLEKPVATIQAEPIENDIYKNSVNVTFTVTDPNVGDVRSGLDTVSYYIIANDTGARSNTVTRTVLSDITGGNRQSASKEQLEASSVYSETLLVDITQFNSNNVEVVLNATDNARNVMDEVRLPLKLDSTKPVVNVTYDNNEVGAYEKYFNKDRTMRVTVTERNFNPDAVRIFITKDGVENTIIPAANEWSMSDNLASVPNGDGNTHTYTYTFADNVDYNVRIECTDLAGNVCDTFNYEGNAVQEFTVDKVKPVITANDTAEYSSETITFTATITEHNFDQQDAAILVTKKLNGATIYSGQPYSANWSSDGDIHTANIIFNDDGDYSFVITYKDKAGNEADAYNSVEFTVDTTDPVLVTNINAANKNIANKGNVNLEFTFTDINADNIEGMISYKVMTFGGQAITDWIPTITATVVDGVQGYTIRFDDYVQNSILKDGIYTIEVTVRDKAGREVTNRQQFSVNRNGSAYSYRMGEYTATVMNNKYVQNITQDLELIVMNCDEVTDYQVMVFNSLNEQIILTADTQEATNDYNWSEENGDYIYVEDDDNRAAGFKLYSCKIHPTVFDAEGTYTVVVSTKDAADDSKDGENATLISNIDAVDNTINVTANIETIPADEVAFTVDRTVPEVAIVGLKNNETYNLDTDFTVDYADANEIQSILIERVSGDKVLETIQPKKSEIKKAGQIESKAKEYNDYQTVRVTVVDAAGNIANSEVRVLVTSNFWVRFINNTPMLIGAIAVIVAAGGLIIFLVGKRRKKSNA